jgi:crotonobetainyl-CoA:carnitine CoA-transferase CaiB-like acyl-CoA transferase
MTKPMQGIRILEVAEHAFVPAASALLCDYGAEVVKIEPPGRGDAARGVANQGPPDLHGGFQNVNRGKQSLGLDLSSPDGRDILYRLAARSDVFLTNKQPSVRRKLQIELEDIRAHNPDIIYVRGTGQGERGPEADRGSYDLLAFWYRSGAAMGAISPEGDIPFLPAPGFGDVMGAMTIAGGIMGAVLHRERTGDAPVVDMSLLATGMWAMSGAIAVAAIDPQWTWPPTMRNPLSAIYRTKDDRWLALCCLQAALYWAPLCEVIGRPELIDDERFADYRSLMRNGKDAAKILTAVFAERTLDDWSARLQDFSGQWTIVQDVPQVIEDPQAAANGYLQHLESATGKPFTLVSAPVQYDGEPAVTRRAPEFNEHGDAILESLGIDWETVVDLKVRGVVA